MTNRLCSEGHRPLDGELSAPVNGRWHLPSLDRKQLLHLVFQSDDRATEVETAFDAHLRAAQG
jgi:hypothetical protein